MSGPPVSDRSAAFCFLEVLFAVDIDVTVVNHNLLCSVELHCTLILHFLINTVCWLLLVVYAVMNVKMLMLAGYCAVRQLWLIVMVNFAMKTMLHCTCVAYYCLH